MSRNGNRKARIEKKFSTNAKQLLIALMPKTYPESAFFIDSGDSYDLDYVEWFTGYGDSESPDAIGAFQVLYDTLFWETTDYEGLMAAQEEAYSSGISFDMSQFYSPWDLKNVTRAGIIRHCRELVRAGVRWEKQIIAIN